MKPIEMFGVIMKSFGVFLIVMGVSQMPYSAAVSERYDDQFGFVRVFMISYASHMIYVVVGYVLLFKTEWLANLSYSIGLSPDADEADDMPPQSSGE